MDDVWKAVSSIATTLHRDRVEAIASAIERIIAPSSFDQCSASFGSGATVSLAKDIKLAWAANPHLSGAELAIALRAATHTANTVGAAESIDLVWTGPKSGLIPTRNTEQVILEVINQASVNLFIVSYVFYNAKSIVAALNDATDRGVSVRILLESSTEHGGVVTGDGVQAMHLAVPKADLFIWNPTQKAESAGTLSAAVHAKCAVADHRIAFITSANLTSAAMERNMELGALVRGGTTPNRLHSHLNSLVSARTLTAWSND